MFTVVMVMILALWCVLPVLQRCSPNTLEHCLGTYTFRPHILRRDMVQVVIRVRPPLPREVEGERMFQNIVSVDKEEHVITISENLNAVLDEVGG